MKNMGIRLIQILVLLGVSFCSAYANEAAKIEFKSIDAPTEIVIKSAAMKELGDFKFRLSYMYHGNDIVPLDSRLGVYSYCKGYKLRKMFLYFEKDYKPILNALFFQLKQRDVGDYLEMGDSAQSTGLPFKNSAVYQLELPLFSTDFLEKTNLHKSIKSRKLSWILVIIDDANIRWFLTNYKEPKNTAKREGNFYFKIRRAFWVEVKYENGP